MKRIFLFFCCAAPLVLLLGFFSCSSEAEIKRILGVSAKAPVFIDCRPVSSTEIVFNFSVDVRLVSANFDPELEIESVEEGQSLKITFTRPLEAGRRIIADILVEDSKRNSLNVVVPFRARNDRMPSLIINEVRTEFSRPRVEFVEFFAPEPGNLGAMRLFIASNSLTVPVYEFPPAEIKAGEYIVLHLRTLDEASVDETGDDLTLSGGNEARPDARDLWVPGSVKLLRRTDALWIMDQDGRIIDALLLSESPTGNWSNRNIGEAAEFLGREKAWLPPEGEAPEGWIPDPASAVSSAGTTATRTICRDESIPPERRRGNWYVTVTSGNSPGRPNDPRRHN